MRTLVTVCARKVPKDNQGSYREFEINSRTYQGLLKDSLTVFKDYKLYTDLSVKILLQKCQTEIMEKLVLES